MVCLWAVLKVDWTAAQRVASTAERWVDLKAVSRDDQWVDW